MEYAIKEIAGVIGSLTPNQLLDAPVSLLLDRQPPSLLPGNKASFFALQSKTNDGHRLYTRNSINLRVRNFVVSDFATGVRERCRTRTSLIVKDTLTGSPEVSGPSPEAFQYPGDRHHR